MDSSLSYIHANVLDGSEHFGLNLHNVSVPSLNIFNILPDSSSRLQYLHLNKVIIGVLQGPPELDNSITVHNDPTLSKKNGVKISNTQIGEIRTHALKMVGNGMDMTFEDSRIGIVRKLGIVLSGGMTLTIKNSCLEAEDSSSISLNGTIAATMTSNKMIIPENFLGLRNCKESAINDNRFILVKKSEPEAYLTKTDTSEDNLEELGSEVESLSKNHSVSVEDFLHPSCVERNTILNFSPAKDAVTERSSPIVEMTRKPIEEKKEITEPESKSEEKPSTTEEAPEFLTSIPESFVHYDPDRQFAVHKVLAYFAAGLLATLIIVIIVLACLLACQRKKSTESLNVSESVARDRRPSLMYVPGGSLYGNDSWATSDPMPSTDSFLLKKYDESNM